MKKLLAILLAAMMVFALAACTNNDDNPSGSENNPGTSQSDNQGGTENQGGWPTDGFGALIPEPDWEYEIIQNDEYRFVATFENRSTDELQTYLQALENAGVSTIGERGEGSTWYYHGKINDMLVQLEDGRVIVEPYK